LGGAANVALNLQALVATPFICTLVGDGKEGNEYIELLKNAEISYSGIVKIADRPKSKIVTRGIKIRLKREFFLCYIIPLTPVNLSFFIVRNYHHNKR
jgi:bifunctional ADP-heptose synthase (sugar kinase/adenylyltransferase)